MALELSGFETVFPGEVYSNDGLLNLEDKSLVKIKNLVLLRRYSMPTDDEVVSYLRQKAEQLKEVSVNTPGEWTPLEKTLIGLPSIIREDLRTADDDCVQFLIDNASAVAFGNIIQMKYGLIPLKKITAKSNRKMKTAEWYDREINLNFGAAVGYHEDHFAGALSHLLWHLKDTGEYKPYEIDEFKQILVAVSAALGSLNEYMQVVEYPHLAKTMDELALEPLVVLAENNLVVEADEEEPDLTLNLFGSAEKKGNDKSN